MDQQTIDMIMARAMGMFSGIGVKPPAFYPARTRRVDFQKMRPLPACSAVSNAWYAELWSGTPRFDVITVTCDIPVTVDGKIYFVGYSSELDVLAVYIGS